MERLLKAKHWQVFMLILGLPLIHEIAALPFIILLDSPVVLITVIPIAIILGIGGLFSWLWTIATRLQAKLPVQIKMPVKRFRIFFFVPLVYIALVMSFACFVFFYDVSQLWEPGRVQIGGIIGLILPVHLFAVFCVLHTLYFAAKSLKAAEQQRVVPVSDFAGDFALLWLFPLGIWFIQPRINQLFDPELSQSDDMDYTKH